MRTEIPVCGGAAHIGVQRREIVADRGACGVAPDNLSAGRLAARHCGVLLEAAARATGARS